MKKNLFVVLFILAASTLVLSCKKDKKDKPDEDPDANLPALTAETMLGYYIGHYGSGSNEPNIDYAFRLKPNSVIVVYDQSADTANGDKAYGTWEYNASTKKLTTYYRYSNAEAKIYSTQGDLKHRRFIGTWGPNQDNTNGGKYNVRYTSN